MSPVADRTNWKIAPAKLILEDDVKRIVAAAKDKTFRTILSTLIYSGVRVSELVHLRFADLYPAREIMVVWPRKKSKHAAVPLDMPRDVLQAMLDLRGGRKGFWVFPGSSGPCFRRWTEKSAGSDGRIVRTARREKICDGGHVTVRDIQRRWDAVLRRLKLKVVGRGIHSLRHYHATRFYEKVRDLVALQRRLNHSSPVISTVYVDIVDGKENMKKFGRL